MLSDLSSCNQRSELESRLFCFPYFHIGIGREIETHKITIPMDSNPFAAEDVNPFAVISHIFIPT